MSSTSPLLNFVDEPDVPSLVDDQVRAYHRAVRVDEEYLDYLRTAHGRRLANCWFRDADGIAQPIQRVLSYATREELAGPPQLDWRGGGDTRLTYSVPYLESTLPNWEEDETLFPFAGVHSEDMAAFDLLCLHYGSKGRASVVFWQHELTTEQRRSLQVIAADFSVFKECVFARQSD